ncbi:hypothetical protein RPB_1953 [Rhodopseudomonas palustris HaA2]|uniref:Uncharacterized protein n=1 Tax=Rhodopseudomonas palustris (strain HaA2) TaxID=316058 RepID=Q2IYP9_RHOP2|nr:hypothetical protein [Rhodopseudomonas palustris]ABD06661.1 hypothetical protein RPB_1953 [Rhodopseudomonas palustris HaA2]
MVAWWKRNRPVDPQDSAPLIATESRLSGSSEWSELELQAEIKRRQEEARRVEAAVLRRRREQEEQLSREKAAYAAGVSLCTDPDFINSLLKDLRRRISAGDKRPLDITDFLWSALIKKINTISVEWNQSLEGMREALPASLKPHGLRVIDFTHEYETIEETESGLGGISRSTEKHTMKGLAVTY